MVKGVTKQVVVVRPAGDDLFEQAIFIVKNGKGVDQEQLMKEANQAAKTFVATAVRGGRGRFPWMAILQFALGIGVGLVFSLWL